MSRFTRNGSRRRAGLFRRGLPQSVSLYAQIYAYGEGPLEVLASLSSSDGRFNPDHPDWIHRPPQIFISQTGTWTNFSPIGYALSTAANELNEFFWHFDVHPVADFAYLLWVPENAGYLQLRNGATVRGSYGQSTPLGSGHLITNATSFIGPT